MDEMREGKKKVEKEKGRGERKRAMDERRERKKKE